MPLRSSIQAQAASICVALHNSPIRTTQGSALKAMRNLKSQQISLATGNFTTSNIYDADFIDSRQGRCRSRSPANTRQKTCTFPPAQQQFPANFAQELSLTCYCFRLNSPLSSCLPTFPLEASSISPSHATSPQSRNPKLRSSRSKTPFTPPSANPNPQHPSSAAEMPPKHP